MIDRYRYIDISTYLSIILDLSSDGTFISTTQVFLTTKYQKDNELERRPILQLEDMGKALWKVSQKMCLVAHSTAYTPHLLKTLHINASLTFLKLFCSKLKCCTLPFGTHVGMSSDQIQPLPQPTSKSSDPNTLNK